MGIRQEEEDPLLVSGAEQQQQEQELHEEENAGSVVRQTLLESKKMWVIAGPSILSRLAMFSMTVITQAFAGHLSDLDLAAISISSTVIIAITFGFLVRYHFPTILLLFFLLVCIFIVWEMGGVAGHGKRARDALWPSFRSQTVPHAGHLPATFLDCSVSFFGSVIAHVRFCFAHTKASWPVQCFGGAVGCGGNVADPNAPELPISVHIAEVLAKPAEDCGYCLDLSGSSCSPRVCELVFCL